MNEWARFLCIGGTVLRKTTSLSTNFFIISLLSFIALCALAILLGLQVYREEMEKKQARLASDAMRIEAILSDWMDATGQYAAFIGGKITQLKNPHDLRTIAELITGKSHDERIEAKNPYVTTTFDWVTPDKMLRVTSPVGVLSKPFDMVDRDYLTRTAQTPWSLQLSAPRVGGISGQWIIPAGLGITNAKGQFLGSITFGFALNGLTQRINQLIDSESGLHYLILNARRELIMDSHADNALGPNPDFALMTDTKNAMNDLGYFSEPVLYKSVVFSHFRTMQKYPFTILTGYSKDMPYALFKEAVLPRLIGLAFIPFIMLGMLYWIRSRFVRPVQHLADAASRLSRGEAAALPLHPIHEIMTLTEQLKKLSDYARHEHTIAAELKAKTVLLEEKTLELENVTHQAIAARDAAVRANRAKSEFLANMSHELRTPMNAVIGLTNIMLMKEYPPARQKEFLQTMQVSADQLLSLINDLLDLAKLETQNVELESIPFDLEALIREVVCVNQVLAQKKKIDFIVHELPQLPGQLIGDPVRLRQVIMNLAGNAVKFTEHGAVSIDCRAKAHNNTVDLEIAVKDTGIGIDKEKVGLIFDKFSQADASTTRKYGGTGLGLSISKTLIELMRGTIHVESTPGKGSCFTVCLSLPFTPSAVRTDSMPASDRFSRTELEIIRNASILIVEDNPANVMVATSLLDNLHCSYAIARNGVEALSHIEKTHYDLILMDVQMPKMDGYQSTTLIRAREQQLGLQASPIIGMTAHALVEERERGLRCGMNDYLVKPFSIADLVEIMRKYLCSGAEGREKAVF